ncbi:MAG: FAD-binding protein, partial [Pseudomonadota bacterium]
MTDMPSVRGRLTADRPMADLTWLRVGGVADHFFQPADVDDLADFLQALPSDVDVFAMGVGSNIIIRDGGLRAVVVRLGRGFNDVTFDGDLVTAGAAALDARVAKMAADQGRDLTFLRTIPGTIGGAVKMNAGCYGSYLADVFHSALAVTRDGRKVVLGVDDVDFEYRQSTVPDGMVLAHVTVRAPAGDPAILHQRMDEQLAKRDETQPTAIILSIAGFIPSTILAVGLYQLT